jgi:hypothetical protein
MLLRRPPPPPAAAPLLAAAPNPKEASGSSTSPSMPASSSRPPGVQSAWSAVLLRRLRGSTGQASVREGAGGGEGGRGGGRGGRSWPKTGRGRRQVVAEDRSWPKTGRGRRQVAAEEEGFARHGSPDRLIFEDRLGRQVALQRRVPLGDLLPQRASVVRHRAESPVGASSCAQGQVGGSLWSRLLAERRRTAVDRIGVGGTNKRQLAELNVHTSGCKPNKKAPPGLPLYTPQSAACTLFAHPRWRIAAHASHLRCG